MLGKTGLSVSRLGLGTDILHAGGITLQDVTRIALRAWELGITLIDTDRWYDVYPALAEAISAMERSQLVLATKTYEKSREGAWNDIHYALDTLKVDYIDLFHLHAVDTIEQYGEMAGALEALQEAKAQGLIRHIGLSTHAVPVMQAMADHDEIEAILTVLNLTGKNMHRSGTRQEMEGAIERSYRAGQGVYIMKPFARGRLFEDENKDSPLSPEQVEQGLSYLYGLPYIHAVIPGMRSIEQVEQCVSLVERLDQPALRSGPR
jgi:predicted aldo/keto reductase-like oxidoreductase